MRGKSAMPEPATDIQGDEVSRLRDEIEQLRTALEGAVEENARLVDDRDRLLTRVTTLARDLQAANTVYASTPLPNVMADTATETEKLSQSEEELRVAFEELQVLTEELEAANNSLQLVNRDLDARVEERTREIAEANAALRASERSFRAIADVVPDLLWRAENGGVVTWYNNRWYDYTGQTPATALGTGWTDAVHPDDRQGSIDVWASARKAGVPFEHQYRIRHRNGDYRWFLVRGEPLRDSKGRVSQWFGSVTDIHELIQLQERQAVLMAELQHRTRNLMAVVETVIRKSLASSRDMADARARIDERFGALSRVQGLLSRRPDGARVTFDALLSDELGAHVPLAGDPETSRVVLDGPSGVELRSLHVQTLALGLHELTTNAVKYGAFAHSNGRLIVRWQVRETPPDPPHLVVDWRETGVPDIPRPDEPARGGGYGRQLIERALPYQLGAKTDYRFEADGVHCVIELPLPSARSESAPRHV
jgi:two-component system CheB/CheR fusion protein